VAARNTDKLSSLVKEIQGLALKCDAADSAQVEAAFSSVEGRWGIPDLVVYNAGVRESREVADYYISKRSIPARNVCQIRASSAGMYSPSIQATPPAYGLEVSSA